MCVADSHDGVHNGRAAELGVRVAVLVLIIVHPLQLALPRSHSSMGRHTAILPYVYVYVHNYDNTQHLKAGSLSGVQTNTPSRLPVADKFLSASKGLIHSYMTLCASFGALVE